MVASRDYCVSAGKSCDIQVRKMPKNERDMVRAAYTQIPPTTSTLYNTHTRTRTHTYIPYIHSYTLIMHNTQ
jgi:hypothetical protein